MVRKVKSKCFLCNTHPVPGGMCKFHADGTIVKLNLKSDNYDSGLFLHSKKETALASQRLGRTVGKKNVSYKRRGFMKTMLNNND